MAITVREVLRVLEQLAPPALAESWDNIGLLVGDARQEVTRVLVALDATPDVLDQAAQQGAELVVTHHPLIFSGLKRMVEDGGVTSLVRRLVREGRSLISMHTNLDAAPDGLNAYVVERLGLIDLGPLLPSSTRPLRKVVVYVPETHADLVRAAMCAAGAGHIGNYSECTFNVFGTGTFRPREGTTPFIGTVGELEQTQEVRLETVVPTTALDAVIDAMLEQHPYEEVAYDIFPMENAWPGAGLGRTGQLATPVTAAVFLDRVREVLGTDRLSIIGDRQRRVETIALCTGAGGDFLAQASRAGADLYLTGEVKHHQALLARQSGLVVIDAGHFATERPAVDLLAETMAAAFPTVCVERAAEEDPLQR